MTTRRPWSLLLSIALGGCAAAAGDGPLPTDDDAGTIDDAAPTPDTGTAPPKDDAGAPSVDTGAPPAGDYPAGPYGKAKGDVISPYAFSGYKNGKGAWGPISLKDYYDPTGSRGVRAIKLELAAIWCTVCGEEAAAMKGKYAPLYGRGARFLTELVADSIGVKATQATADKWIAKYACDWDVVADPAWTIAPKGEGSSSMPYGLLIDPRTMQIVDVYPGYAPEILGRVEALIVKNGG